MVLVFAAVLFLAAAHPVLAAGAATSTPPAPAGGAAPVPQVSPKLEVLIPFVEFGSETASALPKYVSGVYKFLIGIAGILAAVMMMVGGFQYLTAGGDKGRVDAGKKRIENALVGLLLALGSYVLLWSINPGLVEFKSLDIPTVEGEAFNYTQVDAPTPVTIVENGKPIAVAKGSKGNECFFQNYGRTSAEVTRNVVKVNWLNGTWKVHKLVAADLQAAFAEVDASSDPEVVKYRAHLAAMPDYDAYCKVPCIKGGSYSGTLSKNQAEAAAAGKTVSISRNLHQIGAAVDIDSCHNRDTKDCGNTKWTDMPAGFVRIFEKHKFYWGGNGWGQNCRHDAMHFEYRGVCYGS